MTIPGSSPFAAAPYGAVPVIPVIGPEGGPFAVAGPVSQSLLPSAARTASTSSTVQVNPGYRGLKLTFSVTANPGGAQTLAFQLTTHDPVAGTGVALLTVAASATPGGTYMLYPGLSGAAAEGILVTRNLVLPTQWSVTVTHSGVGSWTYVVSVELLP